MHTTNRSIRTQVHFPQAASQLSTSPPRAHDHNHAQAPLWTQLECLGSQSLPSRPLTPTPPSRTTINTYHPRHTTPHTITHAIDNRRHSLDDIIHHTAHSTTRTTYHTSPHDNEIHNTATQHNTTQHHHTPHHHNTTPHLASTTAQHSTAHIAQHTTHTTRRRITHTPNNNKHTTPHSEKIRPDSKQIPLSAPKPECPVREPSTLVSATTPRSGAKNPAHPGHIST